MKMFIYIDVYSIIGL